MFTHTILLACPSPDDERDCGAITKAEALRLFAEFPFAGELSKCALNPNLTVPTLTFTNHRTAANLAVWSEQPGQFTVWFPEKLAFAEVSDVAVVSECIALFFDESQTQLLERMQEVSELSNGSHR